MKPGTPLTESIGKEFGPDLVSQENGVDRRALGSVVFAKPERMRALESLVHPEVRAAIASRVEELILGQKSGVIVVEAIKLLESPLLEMTDAVWFVTCSRQHQETRLRHERGLTGIDAENRIASQPQFDLSGVCTIIENNGSNAELARRVDVEWSRLAPVDG
jgi:dephospho-CoA kinase